MHKPVLNDNAEIGADLFMLADVVVPYSGSLSNVGDIWMHYLLKLCWGSFGTKCPYYPLED